VTAAVELDSGLEGDGLGGLAAGEGVLHLLQGRVEVVDVSVVVLLVVDLHDLPADHRLKGRVAVGQLWQRVLLSDASLLQLAALSSQGGLKVAQHHPAVGGRAREKGEGRGNGARGKREEGREREGKERERERKRR